MKGTKTRGRESGRILRRSRRVRYAGRQAGRQAGWLAGGQAGRQALADVEGGA